MKKSAASHVVLALALIIVFKGAISASLQATPSDPRVPVPYGESRKTSVQISMDAPVGDSNVTAVRWATNEPVVFGAISITDVRGRPINLPTGISPERPFLTLSFSLAATKGRRTRNEIVIDYNYNGAKQLVVGVNIDGQCVNKDYAKQHCDPQIWTCTVDRNRLPVLLVPRFDNDKVSFEAIRSHDRTHRFADKDYSIPFLQFVDATGLGSFLDKSKAPSCAVDPISFSKVTDTRTVANFVWNQNATAILNPLIGIAPDAQHPVNKITLSFPNKMTGYSSVNGSSAEYQFDYQNKAAPTLVIEDVASSKEVFRGAVECVLADGSLSVIRNADIDNNNPMPPRLHLIIEKQ